MTSSSARTMVLGSIGGVLGLALLLASVPGAWGSGGEKKAKSSPRRPNILWIVAENIDLDLGCYGAKHVHTPHLDRLAAAGVRFTRVFATAPVCAPSRSAFMTGMYQTTTDTHHMRSHRDDDFRLPPGVRPLTHWLQDAGYSTFNIGMILRWLVGTRKLDLNFVNEGPIFQSDDWAALPKKQPFFAVINTPEVEYDIYDRKTARKPRVEWVGEKEHPPIAKAEEVRPPPYFPDHPIARAEWARYLNSVSGIDLRVGKVLDALKADGLEDDTIVVFFADNGRLDVRGIHFCYDSGLRVPMIIRWPRNFPAPEGCGPGTVNDQVISLLDLTATTLDLAGLKRPPLMQSRIFLGKNADPPRRYAFSARDRIDETVNRIRSVRDERYRYNRNFMPGQSLAALNRYREKCFLVMPLARQLHAEGKLKGPALSLVAPRLPEEELYDTKTDPFEINNLADSKNPEHREALLRLRAALEVWITDTGDRGHLPEPPEVVAPFEKEMHEWFGTPAWYRTSWPGWRGPDARGVADGRTLPVRWSRTENIVWSVKLPGWGTSSPVVHGERVFVTSHLATPDKKALLTLCFDRASGKELWRHDFGMGVDQRTHKKSNLAVNTPAATADALYVAFGNADIARYTHDGKLLWVNRYLKEFGDPKMAWGYAVSPVVLEDSVLFPWNHHTGPCFLVGLDPESGKVAWKKDRPIGTAHATPLIVDHHGQKDILVSGQNRLTAFDAKTREELWRYGEGEGPFNGEIISSPVQGDGLVFAQLWRASKVHALRLRGEGQPPECVWISAKPGPVESAPLYYRGLLYLLMDNGTLVCLDGKTGRELYHERLGEESNSSPIASDGRIYLSDTEGKTYVVKAGPEFQLLHTNDLGERITASPAVVGNHLIYRTDSHLFCIGTKGKEKDR